jgi:hypothetical protein
MNPPLKDKIPFVRRLHENKVRQWAKTTQLLIDGHKQTEQQLSDEAENATRTAMFHSNTVYQLQTLVDMLRQENIRLKMENERPNVDEVVALDRREAQLAHSALDMYVEWLEEDDLHYNNRPQLRLLIDRLQISLSGG